MKSETRTVHVKFYRRKATEYPNGSVGFSTEYDHTKECTVVLVIDIDALFRELGERAARSRGRKAVLGGGMVRARVTKSAVVDQQRLNKSEPACESCGEPAGAGSAICPACAANHGVEP